MDSVFLEAAKQMIQQHGSVEAKRLCAKYRDMNYPGTVGFAHHNAVLKAITQEVRCDD